MIRYLAHRGLPLGLYRLVIHWHHGVDEVFATGNSLVAVRAFGDKIAHNARVIDKITLQDSGGILETIWNDDWEPQ